MNEQLIKDAVIKAADKGLDVASILSLLEVKAAEAGIDTDAAPFSSFNIEGREYEARTTWLQALYAGFKHHGQLMQALGFQGMPFIEYANSKHAAFGVSVFLLDAEVQDDEESGIQEAYDLTKHCENQHSNWRDWIQGPAALEEGVNAWLVSVNEDGAATFELDCVH